jgi:formamidopyrimidine-DNA glycosylase
MPELPEVEHAARVIRAALDGRTIEGARVAKTRVVRGASAQAVERLLAGQRVRAVERRGKWIRIALDGGGALFSHLGMTGKWRERPPGDAPLPHERARIDARGRSLRYTDQRLFGRLVPSPSGELDEWRALGRDPLADGLDATALGALLAGRRVPVKVALTDQALVAGLGNIQATEALWRAGIDPGRRADALEKSEVARLTRGIRDSLRATLRDESGPEISYVEEPGAPNPFRIYGKAGEKCPRCGEKILKRTIAGRTTAFCRRCQT